MNLAGGACGESRVWNRRRPVDREIRSLRSSCRAGGSEWPESGNPLWHCPRTGAHF